jgi:MFS family permease
LVWVSISSQNRTIVLITRPGLDNTIAANIQGPILDSLGEVAKIPWVGIGFPMGSAAIIFFLGYVFRHFEFKRIFVGSILLFEIGSAICGAAPAMDVLVVGRVIAGMGGAGIYLG